MVIRSGSILALPAYLLLLATAIALLVSVGMLIAGKFRVAGRVALISVGSLTAYLVVAMVIQLLMPQRVINTGDSYCWDLWCMGIDKVSTVPRGQATEYTIDVHIFSDANTVNTSLDGTEVFLMDDQGRRFPLMQDPNVVSINTRLAPNQKINTTLRFVAPGDSRHLFLTGDATSLEHIPSLWRFAAVFMDLHIGFEKISHKPTLLRVV